MPIPQLTLKLKDAPPPLPPEPMTKEQKRAKFLKTNRWAIVGGIALFLALIGIGYTIYFALPFFRGNEEDVTSVSTIKNAVVSKWESNNDDDNASWISKTLPDSALLAYVPLLSGEHRYLVLLQNSTELRATGGFIGNLAILRTNNDSFVDYRTFDSYSVDAVNGSELSGRFPIAPAPIKKYLSQDRLYLRDSNWFPDFRDSAQLALTLYPIVSQDSEPFDAVIAVNPSVLAESLGLLGPIVVDDIEFTQENFVEALEYEVEINAPVYRGKSASERKEIINTLLRELVTRITSLPKKRQLEFVKLAERKLAEKEIQLYVSDLALQNATESFGYAGSFGSCEFDCLAVIDSNLRALKTDSVMSRFVTYSIREKSGSVNAKVSLSYANKGYYDWKTTDYSSYTRVYMPKGSRVTSLKRLDNDLGIYKPLAIDEQGEYRGRSYIGFFHVTKVKTTGEVVLEYDLPLNVSNQIQSGEYSLSVTKQSGVFPEFSFKADFEVPINSITAGKGVIDNGNMTVTTKLISDMNISMKL